MNVKESRKIVVSTQNREAADTLVRDGFEIVGKIGDNIKKPMLYTLWGHISKIGARMRPAVVILGKDRFHREGTNPYIDEVTKLHKQGGY